jgi:hypothetical protein
MTRERRAGWFQLGRRKLTRLGGNGMAVAVTVGVMLASAPALAQDATPTVTPPATPTPAPTSTATNDAGAPTPHSSYDLGKTPVYVVGGLAVVALGVGAVFGGLSIADHQQFVQHPTSAIANRGDSHELTADMCFGVAATFAVTAVVMLFTHEPPVASAASRVTWSPVLGPHNAGAGASIPF